MMLKRVHRIALRPISERLTWVMLTLTLVGCSLGEAVAPNPPPGVPADRTASLAAPVPAPIPHSLDGRDDCFTCHAIGAVDAPPVPSNHVQEVALCSTCHALWLAPAIAVAAPPAIPHDLTGREDCLMCHKLGTANSPRVPDNHTGLTSAICRTCHTAQAEILGVTGDVTTPVVEAPPMPHTLEGFSACVQCHEEGASGVPRFPDDHQGRTDDLCSACHRPTDEEPEAVETAEETASATTASPSDGKILFDSNCAVCHGADGEGTTIAPSPLNDASLLAARTDTDLASAILDGVRGKMPAAIGLGDRDVRDLIAFMRTWP